MSLGISIEEKPSLIVDFLFGFILGLVIFIVISVCLVKKVDDALRHTSKLSKQFINRILSFKTGVTASHNRYDVNLNLHESSERMRSWMYQLIDRTYDPSIFSLSMTKICLVELRGNILLIFQTIESLDRKLMDHELDTVAKFDRVDIYKMDKATVGLQPVQMTKSQYWSKKCPLVLQDLIYLGEEPIFENAVLNLDSPMHQTPDGKQRKTLQFFTRTRRAKEEWFYRFIHASQLERWKSEIEHRISTDFQSDESSTVPSINAKEKRPDGPLQKNQEEYPQKILNLLGRRDRFADPNQFAKFKTNDVREQKNSGLEHEIRYSSRRLQKKFLDQSTEQCQSNRNEHYNDSFYSEIRPSESKTFADVSDLETESTDGSSSRNEHEPSLSLPSTPPFGKFSPLLYFVLTYLQKFSHQHSIPLFLINIFAARCFLDLFDNENYLERMRNFIQKQLEKVHIPFIEHLSITNLNLGDRLPEVQELLKPWIDEHGLWFSMKTVFDGQLRFTLTAKLRWTRKQRMQPTEHHTMTPSSNQIGRKRSILLQTDEASPFQTDPPKKISWRQRLWPPTRWFRRRRRRRSRSKSSSMEYIVPMFLNNENNAFSDLEHETSKVGKTTIIIEFEAHHLDGILLFNIPPIPSDRLWISFLETPNIQFSATPHLGHYRFSFSKIKHRLEKKLRQILRRYLVMPNMKDLIIPTVHDYLSDKGVVENVPSPSNFGEEMSTMTEDEQTDDDE